MLQQNNLKDLVNYSILIVTWSYYIHHVVIVMWPTSDNCVYYIVEKYAISDKTNVNN